MPPNKNESNTPVSLDEIDRELLKLLAERGNLMERTAAAAQDAPIDHGRNTQRLVELEKYWDDHLSSKFPRRSALHILREVFGVCEGLVRQRRVAYLGPPGTFSHMALLQEFGSGPEAVPCSSIAAVFAEVERGNADNGVVPIENSIEGSVTFTHDCFLKSSAMICGEFVFDVRLCLVSKLSELSQIKQVYSHPQPLAQCRTWLATHLPGVETIACSSTTAAAQLAATEPAAAAVGSQLGAEMSGLAVLAQGIEDVAGNATRFVVIAKTDAARSGRDKTSVVFSTPDERGALLRVLSIFDSENLNLSRIESRPDKFRRWEYVFFTDIEGHREDAALARAIRRVQSQCQMVQILGSYPKALQDLPIQG